MGSEMKMKGPFSESKWNEEVHSHKAPRFWTRFPHLKSLHDKQGEQGLLGILANPSTTCGRVRVRRTAALLTLYVILTHFQKN